MRGVESSKLTKGAFMEKNTTYDELGKELRDISPRTGKERPWRRHKMDARSVAKSMYRIAAKHPRRDAAFKKKADRIWNCSNYLVFAQNVNTETGETSRKLVAAQFCRDRLCPMCAWRKSLVTFHQVSDIMDYIDRERPGLIPIFITLTMRNVPSERLADAITEVLTGWRRLTNKKFNRRLYRAAVGWMRTLEITYNKATGEWHPHIHAIVLVDSDYFNNPEKYIDHDALVAEWRWALKVDYDPSVDVRTIKKGRAHAVAEVSKYTVKPGDWIDGDDDATDERVRLLSTVLARRRLVAFGGLMKDVRDLLKQEDAETADLVVTDGEDGVRGDVMVAMIRYEWQVGVTNYVCTEVTETPPTPAR